MAALGSALPSCATDTTDDTTRFERRSTRVKAVNDTHNALAPHFGASYGGITQPTPETLGGGVSLGRIVAIVGSSLALVAVLTLASHGSMQAASSEALLSASASSTVHPRLSKLAAVTVAPRAASSTEGSLPVLGGVDVVAFFAMDPGSAPVFGDETHAFSLETADAFSDAVFTSTFWFASEANKKLFEANPAGMVPIVMSLAHGQYVNRYAPRYGGFCAFGISSEMNTNMAAGMDTAAATEGWPWARDYLGPSGNVESWAIVDGKLYFTFLAPVMDAFLAGGPDLAAAGEARWASWFGEAQKKDGLQQGPFNTECLAASYGPPVERTCAWVPQDSGLGAPQKATDACAAALEAACGDKQGNDPVELDMTQTCSQCLLDHATDLAAGGCASTETAVITTVDKAYCW